MRSEPIHIVYRSATLAAIRVVKRRRVRLLSQATPPITCRRALPLDLSETNPLESSLDRNIEAAITEPSCASCEGA